MYLVQFGKRAYSDHVETHGWSEPEIDLMWSLGYRSTLTLDLLCPANFYLTVAYSAFRANLHGCEFLLVANGQQYGVHRAERHEEILRLLITDLPLPPKNGLTLDFFHFRPRSPAETGGIDQRRINIALRYITIEENGVAYSEFTPQDYGYLKYSDYEQRRILSVFEEQMKEKNRLRSDNSERALRRSIQYYMYGFSGNNHDTKSLLLHIINLVDNEDKSRCILQKWRLTQSIVKEFCTEFESVFLAEVDMDDLKLCGTFAEGENKLYDATALSIWGGGISQANTPVYPAEYIIKSSTSHLVVNSRQYLVFDPETRTHPRGGNPAGLSQLAVPMRGYRTDQPVVLLQDQFDCTNIAHFLFDSCLRACIYCEFMPDVAKDALFVLGGRPTPFHNLVVKAICDLYGLRNDQFLFPRDTIRIRSNNGIYWFSDQVRVGHPLLRCRPEAIAKLRTLAQKVVKDLATDPSQIFENVYLSRADAENRRLANEKEVMELLGAYNFTKIVMSDHSWAEQKNIVSNAKKIVAPHGMALTMLAFNFNRPKVIEFFNPQLGTNAYSVLSESYGNEYFCIFGREINARNHDFEVDLDEIKKLLPI